MVGINEDNRERVTECAKAGRVALRRRQSEYSFLINADLQKLGMQFQDSQAPLHKSIYVKT